MGLNSIITTPLVDRSLRRGIAIWTLAFSIALAGSATAAAGVWIVDDDGGLGVHFQDIHYAVTAAQDGDIILVRAGTYSSFLVYGKSLQIIADGSPVQVTGPGCHVDIQNLSAGQSVVLRGLEFKSSKYHYLQDPGVLRVLDCAGPVLVEDCEMDGTVAAGAEPGWPGAFVRGSASVTFSRSTLAGGWAEGGAASHGLHATMSTVHVLDSTCVGGSGILPSGCSGCEGVRAGSGILLRSGTAFLGGSELLGGDGGDGSDYVLPFTSCEDGGDGGHGLYIYHVGAEPPPFVRAVGCSFIGGAPGDGGYTSLIPCDGGAPGQPKYILSGTLIELPGAARTLAASSPTREGQAIQLAIGALPADAVWLAYSPAVMGGVYSGAWKGYLLVGAPLLLTDIGVFPGALTVPVTIPELGAGVLGLSVVIQTFHVEPGGAVFISPPSVATLLDGGL